MMNYEVLHNTSLEPTKKAMYLPVGTLARITSDTHRGDIICVMGSLNDNIYKYLVNFNKGIVYEEDMGNGIYAVPLRSCEQVTMRAK